MSAQVLTDDFGPTIILSPEGMTVAELPHCSAALLGTSPDLLSIAQRWAALDGGAWAVERHAREKAELLTDTRAAIARAKGETP